MRLSEGPLAEGLQLFAIFGLALAAPLLDLLARHPGFLVVHALVGAPLAAAVACLLALPPLAVWLVLRALAPAAPRGAAALRAGLAGALAGAFALPVLRALPGLPAAVPLAAAAALALAAGLAFARRRGVRAFTSLLAPLPLVPAALLFRDPHVARLLAPRPAPALAAEASADLPPVVIVVFDELPTTSLLGADGQIDAARYPAFADLARHATWFPRASSVGASTLEAVPAILTGRYPDPALLATWADHPQNLFSLLGGSYAMHVHESQTMLHDAGAAARRPAEPGVVASDLGVLWLHAVLPAGLAARLPDVEHAWRDFAWPDASDLEERSDRGYRGRSNHFADFVQAIGPCPGPCLYFHHSLLPHVPWLYTASGRKYQPIAIPGLRREFWGSEPWWVVEGYQRHLLQLAYTDRLLATLLARLRRAGLFDRALVVVTADHGSSFWPGTSRRDPDLASHPGDVLRVPLLVKRPRQREGGVDSRPVETIDILPTIAHVLRIPLPWRVDGCSAFAAECPERREQVMVDNGGHRWSFPVEALDDRESLEHKLSLFATRSGEAGLYRVGPYRRFVDRPVDELARGPDAGLRIEVDARGFDLALASPAAFAASRVVGRFEAPADPAARPTVAIAARGILRAFVPALPGRNGALVFAAQIPEDAFDGDLAQLGVFLVGGTTRAPVLRAAEIVPGEVDLAGVGGGFAPPPRGAVR